MRRKRTLIEGNAECRHLKNLPVKELCGGCLSVWGPEPHIPPSPYTLFSIVFTCIQYTYPRREGGESWAKGKVREATVHKTGSKIPTWLTESPVSVKLWQHLTQSPFTGQFLDDDILLWCLWSIWCDASWKSTVAPRTLLIFCGTD